MTTRLRQDPNEWANKRKEKIEQAKKLKEDRKNGIGEDAPSFAPQVNKRPSYLNNKQPDSLDQLANAGRDPNDPMEQPLPGNKGIKQNNIQPLSPGSDALGKEVKKFSSDAGYKSKFMQQCDNAPPVQPAASGSKNKQEADADEAFLNLLRSDGNNSRRNGPSWNDDTSFNESGQRELAKVPRNRVVVKQNKENNEHVSNTRNQYSDVPELPVNRRATGKPEWNSDASYEPTAAAPLPRKVSPRTNVEAQSKLSLLKQKIRQANGNSSGTLVKSNSQVGSEAFSSKYDDDSYQQQQDQRPQPGRKSAPGGSYNLYDRQEEEEVPRNGRQQKSAVPPRQSKYRTEQPAQQQEEEENFMASKPVRQQQLQKQQGGYAMQYEDQQQLPAPNRRRANEAPQQQQLPPKTPPYEFNSNRASRSVQPPPQQEEDGDEGGGYQYDDSEAYAEDDGQPQKECPDCGRKFNAIPYAKHIKICQKVFMKQRKVFDSTKMRVADNPELAKLVQKAKKEEAIKAKKAAAGKGFKVEEQPGESKWKQQSSAFRDAMRAAREFQKAKETGAPLPPPMPSAVDNSLIPCPHCGRRFNEKAAERHIPQCKNIIAKPTALKRGAGVGGGVGAKR